MTRERASRPSESESLLLNGEHLTSSPMPSRWGELEEPYSPTKPNRAGGGSNNINEAAAAFNLEQVPTTQLSALLVGIAGELVARRKDGRGSLGPAELRGLRMAVSALWEGERVKAD